MNERIQELAKQTMHSDAAPHLSEELYCFTKSEFEKFAELIIRDCISQIAMIGVSNCENSDVGWTVDKSIENIRKHFGVE